MRKISAFFNTDFFSAKNFFFLLLFLVGLLVLLDPTIYVGQNQAMYLYAGDLFLKGQRPFVDFFDINPPLVIYWSAALRYLNKLSGLHFTTFFNLCIFIWFSTLTYATIRLLWRNQLLTKQRAYWVGIASTFVFYRHAILSQIGERDQILAMALLPYLVLKVIDSESTKKYAPTWLRLWLGLSIGLAIAFKPHFLLHFIACEIFAFYYAKKSLHSLLKPETIVIVLIQISYYGHLLLLPEPAWTHFWLEHIPLVREFYSSFARQTTDNLSDLYWLSAVALMIFVCFTATAAKNRPLLNLCGLNFFIALIVLYLQGNFFPYHLAILESSLVVLCLLMWWESIQSSNTAGFLKKSVPAILLTVSASEVYRIGSSSYLAKISPKPQTAKLVATIKSVYSAMHTYTQPKDGVLPLSASPLIAYPWILYHDLEIASRNLFQYQISFFGTQRFYNGSLRFDVNNERLNTLEKNYVNDLLSDIKRLKPKMIYYYQNESSRQNLPLGFPLKDYFTKIGILSEIEKDYHQVTSPSDVIIYIRNSEAS